MRDKESLEEITVRSGPDWTSFVANWLTAYERTLNPKYIDKIRCGIQSISTAPLGLASGPDYKYNAVTGELTYFGEDEKTPNMHLQVCMGGPETFFELIEFLEEPTLDHLVTEYGRSIIYLLNKNVLNQKV